MQLRNRVAVLLAMPLAIFMLLIGWTLLSAGSQQKGNQTKTSTQKEPTFVIMQPNQQILA